MQAKYGNYPINTHIPQYAVMAMTDYGVPGSNHVLPTNTSSRYSSGLSAVSYTHLTLPTNREV